MRPLNWPKNFIISSVFSYLQIAVLGQSIVKEEAKVNMWKLGSLTEVLSTQYTESTLRLHNMAFYLLSVFSECVIEGLPGVLKRLGARQSLQMSAFLNFNFD